MRAALFLAASAVVLSIAMRAQQTPPPQSTFQSGVDVVQVDVSVLDKDRRPVRGLTTSDFTILEDGKPRPIVAFTAVDLPAARPAAPAASWMRDVPADAATNEIDGEGRLVVIMIDRSVGEGAPAITARRIAAAAIDQLGPNDLAAVVFTTNRATPQNFTSDRARLLKAIETPPHATDESDSSRAFFRNMGMPAVASGACQCGLCAPEAVTNVAEAVGGAPQRRKSLLFIGTGISIREPVAPYSDGQPDCDFRLKKARITMFRAAALNNLTIATLDPTGLQTQAIPAGTPIRGAGAAVRERLTIENESRERRDSLRVLAETTGGRAVLDANDPDTMLPAIFQESSSYYVLGFQSADLARDGRFHKIEVKVARRGVDVRTRNGFDAPVAGPVAASSAAAPPLADAVKDLLPKTGLQLSAVAMPFASSGAPGATVLVALNVRQAKVETPARGPEHVEIFTGAFDRNGRSPGWVRQAVDVTPVEGVAGALEYDAVARLDLRPGEYEIRVASEHRDAARTGSVYAYVTVPDFSKAPLSLSGVALQTGSTALATPRDVFETVIPVVPTSRREFSRTETVGVFARVYQGGDEAFSPVAVQAQVVDTAAKTVFRGTATLAPEEFGADRSARFQLDLPLVRLAPGEYLLTVDAALGKSDARRDVRFIVR